MRTRCAYLFLPTLLLLFLACDQGDDDDSAVDLPDELCNDAGDIGDGPYFVDVTEELGLGLSGMDIQASLVATADVNDDRWPDLFLSRGSHGTRDDPAEPNYNVRLLTNDGGTGFADVTFDSGFTDTRDGNQGRAMTFAVFADVDNDGDTDAIVAHNVDSDTEETGDFTDVMLNNGDGTFSLGPETWFSDHWEDDPVSGIAMLDHDHDGNLDLYVGHHYNTYGSISSAGVDMLFEGMWDGAFDDVSEVAGMWTEGTQNVDVMNDGGNSRPSWGVTACDIDGDGWTDMMTASYGRQFNQLWHANGDGTYDDIGIEVGFASDDNEDYTDNMQYGSGSWNDGFDDQPFRNGGNTSNSICGDLDNDGDTDILQIELRHEWAGGSSDMTELLINDGVGDGGEFDRPGRGDTGLDREFTGPMAESWNEGDLFGGVFDFDNDGQLDVLITSSDYPYTNSLLYHQGDDGVFDNVTDDGGLFLDRSHSVAFVDYDRDGDHDVLMGTSSMRWAADDDPPYPGAIYAYLYRNEVGQDGNRLMIDLTGGSGTNRDAIGARIVATAGDDVYMREVIGGHGLDGMQHDPLQIIGTGDHCTLDRLEIHWPDGPQTVTVYEPVRANYVLYIHQDEGLVYLSMDEYLGG